MNRFSLRHFERRPSPLLMGIVNVTPDSFSDGGQHDDPRAAVQHALRLLDEGADILDIGGESTRPPGAAYGEGGAAVDVEEELRRVIPVINGIVRAQPEAIVSIDTMKPEVAQRALEAGATIINDVSAGRWDSEIWRVAERHGAPYVLMHGHDPHHRIAADQARYEDIVADVFSFLRERVDAARSAGVREVIADVGIGFAKGARENIRLLREHATFARLGVPMLVGASRKAFIGTLTGGSSPAERVYGTLAAHAVAATNGAAIVRVHDVRAAREFFTVFQALRPVADVQTGTERTG